LNAATAVSMKSATAGSLRTAPASSAFSALARSWTAARWRRGGLGRIECVEIAPGSDGVMTLERLWSV
jgi:hypothetical protein